jgi:hypothetical protein
MHGTTMEKKVLYVFPSISIIELADQILLNQYEFRAAGDY